jgi:hypothetical protein
MTFKTCLIIIFAMFVSTASHAQQKDSLISVAQFKEMEKNAKYLKCLAGPKNKDPELIKEFKEAFIKQSPWMKGRKIIKIDLTQEGWRKSREDFTGSTKLRYIFADVVITSDNEDDYLVVRPMFFQENKFLSLFFGDTAYKSASMSVYRIKKEDADKICKPYQVGDKK